MRKYRFYYHYFKAKKCMSVHFRGTCYQTKYIECDVPCETKWNRTAPNLIMQGFCAEIKRINDTIYIK